VLWAEQLLCGGVVEEREQRIEVAVNVEQRAGLAVQAELRPGEDLEELVQRAEPPPINPTLPPP
jgi:hypothetical protein